MRLWVASQDYRNDIVVSEERINKVGETYRGIRNALRYQLSNLYDFDPAKHSVPDDKLTGLDRWILGEFSKLEAEVLAAYDQYEFHVVYQKVSQFIAVELSVDLSRRHQRPALHRRREFASPPLHADRAAPAGDRPVPDARADPGLHGGRSVGICAGQNRRIRSSGRLATVAFALCRSRDEQSGKNYFELRELALARTGKSAAGKNHWQIAWTRKLTFLEPTLKSLMRKRSGTICANC